MSPPRSGSREASPSLSQTKKRKTASESPSGDGTSKKKKSRTPTPAPPDVTPFDGMITRDDLVAYFRQNGIKTMQEVIAAFKPRIAGSGANQKAQERLFLWAVSVVTDKDGKVFRLKEEFAN